MTHSTPDDFVRDVKTATISGVDDALRNWILTVASGVEFALTAPAASLEAPAEPRVHAWLYQIVPSGPVRPARGPQESRATLRYLLTVSCADESKIHTVLQALLAAAVDPPAAAEEPLWTLAMEPPADAFWLALKVPSRPCLILSTELKLPRPAVKPAPPVREVRTLLQPDAKPNF